MNQAVKHPQINFELKRSRRKTVAIHIENNSVEIRAPYSTPKWFIEQFINEKRQWVLERLLEQEQKQSEIYQIENGTILPFLGSQIQISIKPAKRNSAKLINNKLTLSVSDNTASTRVKLMDRWLLAQAKKEIPELVEIFAKEMDLWNSVREVKFRKTKTKWGHCTAQGVLQFNPLILLAPEFVMNYLIAHELCHLIHQNHSKTFWQLVSQFDPNYQEAESWLKEQGHRLWYQ